MSNQHLLEEKRTALYAALRGQVIVSVQAPDGHAMRDTATLTNVAAACVDGGASAIRCGGHGGIEDIRSIVNRVPVPVFGLTKEGADGVYITPTRASVQAVAEAGATVVCTDATFRPRPDGSTFAELVVVAHNAGALIMADCATPEEILAAHESGADFVSTTLAGYTEHRKLTDGPDFDCLRIARKLVPEAFLIGEGRFHTPAHAAHGHALGADALIIGTAITDPGFITGQFQARFSPASR